MTQFNSLSQEDIFSPPLYLVSTIYLMISTSIKSDACEKDIKSQKKGYPNFLGGSNLGGNLGDNNEK